MRRFKIQKATFVGILFFSTMLFLSLTAELWSNNKPLILYFKNEVYFPIFKSYHPSLFGQTESHITDYRSLQFGQDDLALWPLNQWDPFESNKSVEIYPSPPTQQNIFGTDDRGRDVLARLLYGFRTSILYAVGVWLISYLLGVFIGSLMGYFGGWVDLVGMRIIEIMDSIPALLILVTLTSIFTPNLLFLILISVLFGWTSIATYIRAEFFSIKKREFVESAKLIGSSNLRIIFRHILPNAITPIVTFSPFNIASSILVLANMDYLGFGLQAPTPSWGELIYQAQKYITIAEWLVWWPSLLLVLTLISLVSIGLGVQEIYGVKKTIK